MANKLQIVFAVVDDATKQIDKVQGKVARFSAQVNKELKRTVNLRNVALVTALVAIGKGAVDAASQIEVFQRQLMAVTKSSAEATQKLNAIREFARTTPLETEDVVQAYVRLRAVGIDPTTKQMETLGGVALLFNRDMSSMADAFIGMNKRTLRELGVEIDRTGKKATVSSGNMRIVTEKDSASIRRALLEIWESRFPNAMGMASDTFKAKIAVMKSEWFEFQTGLGKTLISVLTGGVESTSEALSRFRKNLYLVKTAIMIVVAAVATLFNGFQMAADAIVLTTRTIWNAVKFMGLGVWNVMQTVTRALQAIGAAVAAVTVAIGKTTAAAATMRFGDVAGIWAEAGATLKVVWDDVAGGIGQDFKDIGSAAGTFWDDLVIDSKTAGDRTRKNFEDIGNAMYRVVEAYKESQEKIGGDIGGTGALGVDAENPMDTYKNRAIAAEAAIRADKDEIRVIQEKIKANEYYAKLVADGITNDYQRRRLVVETEETEALGQIERWEREKVITHARAEEMRTQASRNAAQDRMKIAREENTYILNQSIRATNAILGLLQTAVEGSKAAAKDKQGIMYGLAIAQAAAAAVEGIYAVWTDDSINSVWGKIAMTAVVVAEILASAWTQIDAISSAYARGTSFAPGGRALVGEQGPEMVTIPRGGQVYTNYQTRNEWSPSLNVTLQVSGETSPGTVRSLRGELEGFARRFQDSLRYGYLRRTDLERALA